MAKYKNLIYKKFNIKTKCGRFEVEVRKIRMSKIFKVRLKQISIIRESDEYFKSEEVFIGKAPFDNIFYLNSFDHDHGEQLKEVYELKTFYNTIYLHTLNGIELNSLIDKVINELKNEIHYCHDYGCDNVTEIEATTDPRCV